MKKQIYLDYAASTPIDKKVLEAMTPYMRRHYGNPSSTHRFGQKAKAAIEQAREHVAHFLHCQAQEVIFTGGATEANNLAIKGIIQETSVKRQVTRPHIVTTAIEHESVLEPCKTLEKEGMAEVTYVKPQKDGIVLVEDIKRAIKQNTILVSVMYANSEIGTIQPIAEIAEVVHNFRNSKHEARNSKQTLNSNSKIQNKSVSDFGFRISDFPLFHTDAVQAANYLNCDVEKLGVDLLTLSGHKIYGPKGIGVLYKRAGVPLLPLIEGGGQEIGLRSGTENVAAIVGMGAAIQEIHPVMRQGAPLHNGANPELSVRNIRIRQLRDRLIKAVLRKISESKLTGSETNRLPNNAHLRFQGVEGRTLVIALDQKGIAVATGSACSEKTQEPSHVLLALGLTNNDAVSAVRITLGKQTKLEEIDKAVKVLAATVAQLRKTKI